MAQEVVVLGGGVGGTVVANQLARQVSRQIDADEVHLTQISASSRHVYQPLYLYMAFDQANPAEAQRPQASVLDPHVRLITASAERIDREGRDVILAGGQRVHYDYLVLATGSRPAPEQVPGLKEDGHWFYTEEAALRLRDALHDFTGGRIVLVVGVPHKCPVAPLEFTFILDEWLRARGVRDRTELTYTYPVGRLHSLEPVARWAEPVMAQRSIHTETFFNVDHVDPQAHTVTSVEGTTLPYDLLVAIPPHTGQQVILDSGIGDKGGWVPTDRHTLQMVGDDRIYVCGDTTNLPISKAGSTAHFEADVVAANLASRLQGGHGTARYDGKVLCFIETGLSKATYVAFDYENPPQPKEPSALLHHMKLAYNRMYWLTSAGVL